MARAYNADPNATNLILRRLNLDIIVDQAYEIGLLRQIVDRFPGDPEAVELDRFIHCMDMPHEGRRRRVQERHGPWDAALICGGISLTAPGTRYLRVSGFTRGPESELGEARSSTSSRSMRRRPAARARRRGKRPRAARPPGLI
jgi:hypothetical protein